MWREGYPRSSEQPDVAGLALRRDGAVGLVSKTDTQPFGTGGER